MDAAKGFLSYVFEPMLPLLLPITFTFPFIFIIPGYKDWWVTHPARVISINVATDEVIKSMGWNDLRPRVLRVPMETYDDLFAFRYNDGCRLLVAFAGAFCNILLAYWNSALDNDDMIYCHGSEQVPNPDIVGMGARLSTYILLLTVFASLFIGSFHSGLSGTKELGVATLINLLSMAVNLIKVQNVTPTDVFVVFVMIDTHCVALSATLSSKEALASRLYVRLVLVGQAIAWAAVLYVDIQISVPVPIEDRWHPFPWGDPLCDKNWFDSIIRVAGQHPWLPFRIYWIFHAYDLIQPAVLAACHTGHFDKLEKIDRDRQDVMGGQDENQTGYSRLPSTAFSVWTGFVLYPIMLVVAVENHLWRYETDVGSFREWGQSVAIITCVCGTAHWVYVNIPILKHPFRCLWQGRWILRKGPVLPTNTMRLIAVGVAPSSVGEENYKLLTADKPE